VGGNPYQPAYVRQLETLADRRVIFTGAVYGDAYWSLQKNAGVFVFAGEIGGIHPALVEAMAAGNAILYLDTPANRETARDCGIPFHADESDLAAKLEELIVAPSRIEELAQRAQAVARKVYGWNNVVDQYEELFVKMLAPAKLGQIS
jgi:glycosyltransferase involved in cell wall biosynthesis